MIVVHVDDHAGIPETTAAHLEKRREEFTVIPETGPETVRSFVEDDETDRVVTDDTPKMDGRELLRETRRVPRPPSSSMPVRRAKGSPAAR